MAENHIQNGEKTIIIRLNQCRQELFLFWETDLSQDKCTVVSDEQRLFYTEFKCRLGDFIEIFGFIDREYFAVCRLSSIVKCKRNRIKW